MSQKSSWPPIAASVAHAQTARTLSTITQQTGWGYARSRVDRRTGGGPVDAQRTDVEGQTKRMEEWRDQAWQASCAGSRYSQSSLAGSYRPAHPHRSPRDIREKPTLAPTSTQRKQSYRQ